MKKQGKRKSFRKNQISKRVKRR